MPKLAFKVFLGGIIFSVLLLQCRPDQAPAGVSVTVRQPAIPVLMHKTDNPVLRITIEADTVTTLSQLQLSTGGTSDLTDIAAVRLFYTGADTVFSANAPYGESQEAAGHLSFRQEMSLQKGRHHFFVSFQISDRANLLNRVNARLESVHFPDGILREYSNLENSDGLRLGVALRQHNQDGVHTHRIPGLATTRSGALLAVYDARRNSSRDLQGDIDIGLNRSTDGGQTWSPMQSVLDMGTWGGLPEKFNGVSDACILVDQVTGDIYVAGLWMYGVINSEGQWIENLTEDSTAWNHQWRNRGSQPGFGVKETSQFLLTKSTDDGLTWSEPVNLTTMCKKEEWWLWAPAPGRGITLQDGTLVFPTQGRDREGLPFSNITYSKDRGKTWTTSNPAYHNTTECAVAELSDGRLMLNIRDNRNRENKTATNGRAIFTTHDLGQNWEEHPSHHGALPEPTCMASLHRHSYEENGEQKSVLLFSNPNSKYQRDHLTVKISFDEGKTWPSEHWILLDEGRSRGYSCLTSVDERTIGILYESSQADLVFQKIPLEELVRPGYRVNSYD